MPKPKRVRCNCGGSPGCRLCKGAKFYEYTPTERGWMPFRCPTCEGSGAMPVADAPAGTRARCITCRGEGTVDPANPPYAGAWDVISKIFLGA